MATTFVLTRPDVFVSGVVAAYVKPALGVPASGAPSGSAVSSPSVVGNSVTFTGLADNTQYIAYQGSPDRYVSFRTTPASSVVAETDPIAEADLATHAALTTTAHGGLIPSTLPDAKGDLLTATADNTPARLAAGSNGQMLTAQSGQATGLLWAAAPSGSVAADAIFDAKGDLPAGTGADTASKLAVGANDLVLTADSSVSNGLAWKRTQGDRKRRLWLPTGISGTAQSAIIDENFSRSDFTAAGSAQTSAAMKIYGGCVIPAGVTCSKAIAYLIGAGSGLTHAWAVLTDQTGNILAITADDTSATSSALSFKTFTWTVAYPAVADIGVYVGLCWVGSGLPTMAIKTVASGVSGEAPRIAQTSNTGLTDPASLGAGPVALTANTSSTWVAIA